MRWLKDNYFFPAAGFSRRSFLRSVGGADAGLIIGVHLRETSAQASGAAAILRAEPSAAGPLFNGFVRVAPDNTVTVLIKHLEMGQGPYTGLATLVAEEMDADWSQVRSESAPSNADLYKNLAFGMQGTGGSTAIANSYEQMRQAGAAARAMLVNAAATWKVPADEITVQKGDVASRVEPARALASWRKAAARLTLPTDVKLKDPKQFKLIGKDFARVDGAAKTNGTAMFTLDVDRPGALTVVMHIHPASARRRHRSMTPQPGKYAAWSTSRRFRRALRSMRTVSGPRKKAAMRCVSTGMNRRPKRAHRRTAGEYRTRAAKPGAVAATRGEPERAMTGAAKVIEAEYVFPFLAHAPMEPLDCVMELQGGACRAWYGAQLQTVDHQTIAKVMGLAQDKVAIQTMMAGQLWPSRSTRW